MFDVSTISKNKKKFFSHIEAIDNLMFDVIIIKLNKSERDFSITKKSFFSLIEAINHLMSNVIIVMSELLLCRKITLYKKVKFILMNTICWTSLFFYIFWIIWMNILTLILICKAIFFLICLCRHWAMRVNIWLVVVVVLTLWPQKSQVLKILTSNLVGVQLKKGGRKFIDTWRKEMREISAKKLRSTSSYYFNFYSISSSS